MEKKIDSLTDEQQEKLIEHRKEYLSRGLSCEPIDIETAKKNHLRMYELIGKEEPYYWVCQSPYMCNVIINLLRQNLSENLSEDLRENLRQNLKENFLLNLRQNLSENLSEDLRENFWQNISENLWQDFWQNLGQNISENLGYTKYNETCFWGQMDNSWIAFYQFPRMYLGIDYGKDNNELLDIWDALGRSCCWWYPFENIIFVSDRPSEIHKNELGQLHKDGGPALLFRDGYSVWALNGVNVPQYLAETPEGDLDIDFFKQEKNADIKAEFIQKFGIDRMVHMGNTIDKWQDYKTNEWWVKSEYELIDMSPIFESISYAPHLKMKNQTTGVYHLEGVDPNCRTIEQALNFRWNDRKNYKTEVIK